MAALEREFDTGTEHTLGRGTAGKLERAASVRGQSLNEFAVSALLRAADDPLDRVIGIFQDEPLMDALMERVRADRHAEIEAEIEAEIAE